MSPELVKRLLSLIEEILQISKSDILAIEGGEGSPVDRSSLYRQKLSGKIRPTYLSNIFDYLYRTYGIIKADVMAEDAEERFREKKLFKQNKKEEAPMGESTLLSIRHLVPTGQPDQPYVEGKYTRKLEGGYEPEPGSLNHIPGYDSLAVIPNRRLLAFFQNEDLMLKLKVNAEEASVIIQLDLPEWVCSVDVLVSMLVEYRRVKRSGEVDASESVGN